MFTPFVGNMRCSFQSDSLDEKVYHAQNTCTTSNIINMIVCPCLNGGKQLIFDLKYKFKMMFVYTRTNTKAQRITIIIIMINSSRVEDKRKETKQKKLTVIALPCILWFLSLVRHRAASCLRFMQMKAHPRGGIKSMLTMSPNSPNVSDRSSWWTNFDKWPTHNVVLHTARRNTTQINKDLSQSSCVETRLHDYCLELERN